MIAPTITPPGLEDVLKFPLLEALLGRRSRRFAKGDTIPDGPLTFSSQKSPEPLSELEQMLVLNAVGGNTGWNYLIARHAHYAPYLSNYAGTAGGRTFPSAAGFHTSEIFFTNDEGVFLFPTRDAPALTESNGSAASSVQDWIEAHRQRIVKVRDGRLRLPAEVPHMEGHNTWCANVPGSLLVFPVIDLAQHCIAGLCYLVQNGFGIYDDLNDEPIPGLEHFGELIDLDDLFPLSRFEHDMLSETNVEIGCACYAGMLMLQAMGLGGWMYNGLDRYSVLGASGDSSAPGVGFRCDTDARWTLPNPTGLPGIFEAHCPPHFTDMRAAVDAFCQRKFGAGGPFHPDTPGPWRDSPRIRGSAQRHSEPFKQCVAAIAQTIYDRFGKFPGTLPSAYCFMYLQAHHLDLAFYDHYFKDGAYLPTHARHDERWHENAGAPERPRAASAQQTDT